MDPAPSAPPWARYLPGVHTMLHYDRRWLRSDVLAGLTVCAYLIPQVMAYAQIAGLPAVVGLWGMCAPLLVYAVVGASRRLSVGPESTTALMTAAVVGTLAGSSGGRAIEVASLLAIVVGVICVVAWVFRLGFLANLLSRPVLVGYLTGIAVLMICSQLGKVFGVEVSGDRPHQQVLSLLGQLASIHLPTTALAFAVLLLLFVLHRLRPSWPGPLLVMLAAGAATAVLGPGRWGLRVVGEVPAGLPVPWFPRPDGVDVVSLLPFALAIAVVGYSDNVLTARAFAEKHQEPVDAGQELVALGLTNIATGLFHGFPASSSSSRTALADTMGARTQLHSLVALAGLIGVLLVAGPVLATFPLAALGAVVIFAATRLVDVAELRRIARFRRSEILLTAVTALGVVALGVLAGIGVAVTLSLLDLIRRIVHPHDGVLGYVPGLAGMHDVGDYPDAVQIPGLVVYRYDSPLFFANAPDFLKRAQAAVAASKTPVEWFLLNAEANVEVDLTAVDTLAALRSQLAARGIVFAMARVKQELRDDLSAAGFIDALGSRRIFATLPAAVVAYADEYERRHGRRPDGLPQGFPRVI